MWLLQTKLRMAGLIAGPMLFSLTLILDIPQGVSPSSQIVLATALLMAVWWVTEALPIFATSLIPLVAFPLGQVATASEVSTSYMDSTIVLFMGGFFLAMAIQKCDLHRRIALAIISLRGGDLSGLVLGFMAASAFLSMWVSNTATTIMMLPIALAVLVQLQSNGLDSKSRFPVVLLLAIAYSASVGGIATLIGTPPNIVFTSQFAALFPEREEISFGKWMLVGVPFALIFLSVIWFFLTHLYTRLSKEEFAVAREVIASQRAGLGPMSGAQKGVSVIFFLTALAWIFRRDLTLGSVTLPGWSSLLGVGDYVHDSTVAVVAALLLFMIPTNWRKGEFLLDWSWAVKIPWGILLLFGGGIALARGFQITGLADWIGQQLVFFKGLPVPLLVLALCLLVTFMTELTSNVATATLFMPILAGTATALDISPELLMIPATMSASCAFMLPVATPPNAIVFGSDYITIPDMCRAGFWLNLAGALIVTLLVYAIAVPVFGIEL